MKLTIGAVARALGMNAKTIRFYEGVGLVPPADRQGDGWFSAGRRVYENDDVERLRFVKEARKLDFSIEEIKQLLTNYESGPPCGCAARPLVKQLIDQKLDEVASAEVTLANLRSELEALRARTEALENKRPRQLQKEGFNNPFSMLGTPGGDAKKDP